MYVVFYGCGSYKIFHTKEEALIFCENLRITWVDKVG
jgi:viroplasmin and RNaseH domain-containing protein